MAPRQAPPEALSVMASGFAKLMVSQVATRLVTFSMNLLIARQLSPEAYGLSAVQFHLITTTILFLSREGFRRGGLRIQEAQQLQEQQQQGGQQCKQAVAAAQVQQRPASVVERVLAVSWLVLPIGAAVSSAVCGFVLWRSRGSDDDAYRRAVVAHGVAALLELLVEPLYIISATRLEFGRRAAIDAAANVAKCGLTLCLVSRSRLPPASVFGAAQLAFGAVVAAGYGRYGLELWRKGELRMHHWRWDSEDRATLRITWLFSLQAAEKLVLSEGSKLALVGFESSYNQGVYGLVANLGSLVVRLLFTPIEEAAFTAFSRAGLAARSDAAARRSLAGVLAVAVKAVSIAGLLALTYGPWYSYTLLRAVYSSRWADSEAPAVLGAYTACLLLLAVNGITEAFVHAVLEPSALRTANALLVVFAASHVAASAALVQAGGALGLVAADTLNMALRIAFSLWFIGRYFRGVPGFSTVALLPGARTLAGCAASAACLAASQAALMSPQQLAAHGFWRQAACHVGVGVGVLAALGGWVVRAERQTMAEALALLRPRQRQPAGREHVD